MTESQPLWKPTHVMPQQVVDTYGRIVNGKRVHYRVSDGTQAYVDIPDSNYNAQTVQDTIHKAVQKHFQIMSLEGPPSSMGADVESPPLDNVIR